jgi:hypothetical protein
MSATLGKIRQALGESLKGEKEYHGERVAALEAEAKRLEGWIEKAYMDRLSGVLTPTESKGKSSEWRNRLFELQNGIRAHQSANVTYLDQAERILDLAQRAHSLYQKQDNNYERRKLIDTIISKVVISDRRTVLKLREPFGTLSKLAFAAKSGKSRSGWYARQDLNL